jgi:hypothetical protein
MTRAGREASKQAALSWLNLVPDWLLTEFLGDADQFGMIQFIGLGTAS